MPPAYDATNPSYTMPTTGAPYPPPTYPAAYPPPSYPTGYPSPYAGPPPKPRSNVGLIVGLSVGIPLLLIVAFVAGSLLIARAHTSSTFISTPPGKSSLSYTQIFKDPMTSNINGWASDTHCFFGAGGYHVKDGYLCYAPIGNVGNDIVSTNVKQVAGPITYFYGILVRHASQGNYYTFEIDSNGKWRFGKGADGQFTEIIPYVPNAAIHRGLNVTNSLKVMMQGSNFTFFINGTQVGQVSDTTYTSGKCGVDGGGGHTEEVFTNFEVDAINS
jgi:hypothetical protein